MIYLYDKAIVRHLGKYFDNVICLDDETLTDATKRVDMKSQNPNGMFPMVTVKRTQVEHNLGTETGGMGVKQLLAEKIYFNSTFKYNEEDRLKAMNNGVLEKNKGYNYSVIPLPIDLKYTISVIGDNKEDTDNRFCDILFVMYNDCKIKLDRILSEEFTDKEFYTDIIIENTSYDNPNEKQSGARYKYNIEIRLSGAKIYYTSKEQVVLSIPVNINENKKGGN